MMRKQMSKAHNAIIHNKRKMRNVTETAWVGRARVGRVRGVNVVLKYANAG